MVVYFILYHGGQGPKWLHMGKNLVKFRVEWRVQVFVQGELRMELGIKGWDVCFFLSFAYAYISSSTLLCKSFDAYNRCLVFWYKVMIHVLIFADIISSKNFPRFYLQYCEEKLILSKLTKSFIFISYFGYFRSPSSFQ